MKKFVACFVTGLLFTLLCSLAQGSSQEPLNTSIITKRINLLSMRQSELYQLQNEINLKNFSANKLKEMLILTVSRLTESKRSYELLKAQLSNDEKQLNQLKKRIETPTLKSKDFAKKQFERIQKEYVLKKKALKYLAENIRINQSIRGLLEKQLKLISSKERRIQKQNITKQYRQQIEMLQKRIDSQLNAKLKLQEDTELSSAFRQAKIELLSIGQETDELTIEYLNIRQKLSLFNDKVLVKLSLANLNARIDKLNMLLEWQKNHQHLIEGLILHAKELNVLWTRLFNDNLLTKKELSSLNHALAGYRSELSSLVNKTEVVYQQLNAHKHNTEKKRSEAFSSRQQLLPLSIGELHKLLTSVIAIPGKLTMYLYSLYLVSLSSFTLLSIYDQGMLICAILGIFIAWWLGRKPITLYKEKSSDRVTTNIYYAMLYLLELNWGGVCLFLSLLVTFSMSHLSYVSYRLIVLLFSTWFFIRVLVSITRLVLLENESHIDGHDVRLFYRLRLLFIAGGFVTFMMILSHELHLPHSAELFSRLFMLFLLGISLLLFRAREVLFILIKSTMHLKRIYVKRAVSLVLMLVPISLMINAGVGLIGFTIIAWKMGYYLLISVLSLFIYMIIRGILNDLFDIFAQFLISNSKNGWFWGEAVLKPLSRIIRALLFTGLLVALFFILGLSKQEKAIHTLWMIWQFNLFHFTQANITIGSFIEFSFLVLVFIWMAKWTRECCYRWFFRYLVNDLGIRNSLSVFTQYLVVTIGTIITLRVLGVDVSGVSMILGGLAVGMGFGLRDFANNIVGGLMLLIERPVKVGDLISIDNTEGRVMHIGIRSMRIRSWDHMEVLIPNSETFTKPFTNWTHQDSVVRTVITVKVSRKDSASNVQTLILEVLAIIPEVLKDPEPQVYLKQIDEALLEFEVRYFINVELHSRMEVRSIVLFAITAQFKACGIKAPVPPLSIENVIPCKS